MCSIPVGLRSQRIQVTSANVTRLMPTKRIPMDNKQLDSDATGGAAYTIRLTPMMCS